MDNVMDLMIGVVLGYGACFGNSFIRGFSLGILLFGTLTWLGLVNIA